MSALHDTAFMLPNWWVELFDRATVLNTAGGDPDAFISTVKFLPYLKPLQLKLCSQIISVIQQQLLASSSDTIVIALPTVYNELQLLTRRQQLQAQLLLHELRSFRLLQPHGDNLHTYPLFADEVWSGTSSSPRVELRLAAGGRELLLGYCEPYADFVRRTQHGLQLRSLCDNAPLHLWKSVWLDMQGAEHLLYLRLEAAAQHHGNWLNLEHTICQSLPELLAGLQYRDAELLRLLTTLGKKLSEHGCLLPHPATTAVFMDAAQRQQTQLLWTLQRFPTVQTHRQLWQQAVCADLCNQQLATTLEELLTLLVPDRRQRHQKLLDSFKELLSRLDAQADVAVLALLSPGCPLLDIALFFEWCLRRLLPDLPLPNELAPSAVSATLDNEGGVPLHTRFANFRNWLKEHPHFTHELRSIPQACLVSSATASVPTAATPSTAPPPTTPPEPATPSASEPPAAATGEGHLRKIAALELQKITARSRAEYNKLEHSYFTSLSPAARQSILEVKKHMQAGIFENHLRPRLISFMIENPSSWQRTDAVRDLRFFD